MIKKSLLILGLTVPLWANCGNNNGNGNGCSGGGDSVTNITNVTNVTNVSNVSNTTNNYTKQSVDPRMTETRLGFDTALRLYDGKRVQLQVYNIYSPSLHDKEDVIGDGRNLQYGVRFVFKLGKSYEENLLEKQAAEIKALEAMVERMAQ